MRSVDAAQDSLTRSARTYAHIHNGRLHMERVIALLSHLLRNEWREIGSAPFAIEVGITDGNSNKCWGSCLRHGDGWLHTETLRPVEMTATLGTGKC